MGSKQKNLIGERFNYLIVIKQLESVKYGNSKKRRWLCSCDCGNETEQDTGSLTSGRRISCGCMKKIANAENSRKSRHLVRKKSAAFNSMIGCYRRNAVKRNLTWELSREDVLELFTGNCFYCGQEPSNSYNYNFYYKMKYSGIDRIDNTIGYTKSNVVSCCKICNHAKHTMTQKDFINWIYKAQSNLQRLISDIERDNDVTG